MTATLERAVTAETVEAMAARIRGGDRRALARAITLVESRRADHRERAEALLEALAPVAGGAVRIGISGPPGVGKSTFIEAFGLHLTGRGHRVAVLAVDPSSQRSGGSILGDKTRMELLTRDPAAFIRPSPAGATLGGVARRTRETMLLCEAAGYDVVIVETVGVGQSETAVAQMVDVFLLLLLPGAGDELQGIKRGIVEVADILVVNKADGELKGAANHAAAEYRHALALLRGTGGWTPPVLQCSALENRGIDKVWDTIGRFRAQMGEALAERRAEQARSWLWRELGDGLLDALRSHPAVAAALPGLEADVVAGRLLPTAAARRLLGRFLER
ncbi:methylmalonyl Co-A mutase-associated GTPase MeaB [Inquilinus limosus]|uniref:methylmalonyl Co-A mutase-associated GTPase MeaB n=1 Tax=Inquilinus limosus TaxID=171674 RepID=UPI003F147967